MVEKEFGVRLVTFCDMTWPWVCLVAMVLVVTWGLYWCRRAILEQPSCYERAALESVTRRWLKSFSFVAFASAGVSMALSTFVTPVYFPVFVLLGLMVIGFVIQLGRHGLANRHAVASALSLAIPSCLIIFIPSLLYVGQTVWQTQIVCCVLILALVVILPARESSDVRNQTGFGLSKKQKLSTLVVLMGCLALFSISLWRVVSTKAMVQFVESMDSAKYQSANWGRWGVIAQWVQDAEISVDLSKPRGLFLTELAQIDPNYVSLWNARRGGLLRGEDYDRIIDKLGLPWRKQLLVDANASNFEFILTLPLESMALTSLEMQGGFTPSEKRVIESRLLTTLKAIGERRLSTPLEDLEQLRAIAETFKMQEVNEAIGEMVKQTLEKCQVLRTKGFFSTSEVGGFSMYHDPERAPLVSLLATADAIKLMDVYGVPEGVNVQALRSYLRPDFYEDIDYTGTAADTRLVREVCRQRLDRIEGVPKRGWIEFLRSEVNLISACLFSGLCCIAAWICPLSIGSELVEVTEEK